MIWCYSDNKTRVDFEEAVTKAWEPLATAFENNVLYIYNLLRALGSTPASHSPSDVANAIQAINDSIYAKLQSLGQTPSSKQVADLNAKIQALTEVTWTDTVIKNSDVDEIGGRYQVRNVKEIRVTSVTATALTGVIAYFYNASGEIIGSSQRLYQPGIFTIPSNARYVTITAATASAATIQWTFQTKVLR